MKHLLIILSFLLLSSCTKQGFLYRHGEVNEFNVYTWDTFGDQKYNPIYEGEIYNGKPYGFGTLTFPNGEVHIGEFGYGVLIGRGRVLFPN
jgi:hypothetical protein